MKGPENLTVRDALTLSTDFLQKKGSSSARLDAQLLTAHVLRIRRLDLYLSPERPLTAAERDGLRTLLVRRGMSEPVAYLTGHREFFGMDFLVTPDVLIPRPETESIVDAAIAFLTTPDRAGGHPAVADIGTGSGAIACTIAARIPDVSITATDISEGALGVAERNAAVLGVGGRVTFVRADVLTGVTQPEKFDLIVSNPPYIAESEASMTDESARMYEPAGALFSGPDGTGCTFAIIDQAVTRLTTGGALMVEVGTPGQTALVADRLRDSFENVSEIRDPGGVVRGLTATGVTPSRTPSKE